MGTALLMLAGCADSGGSSTSTASGTNAASGSAAHAPADFRAAASAGQPAGPASLDLVPVNQSIIYTASLTLRVRDVSAASATVSGYITSTGGYTADEQARTSEPGRQRPTISLTLKVPSGEYPAVLRHLAGLGRQTTLIQRSTDVTQQVADVNSRVTSEQDAIAQLRALLKRAGSVSGLLQVQQQISSDESSLEALLAQQRALSHETAYATITLRLYGPLPPVAHRHQAGHGFGSGLAAGWRGLKAATGWVLTALGVLAPFLLIAAIVGGLAYLVRRRLSRRAKGSTPAAGAG
ncbi:MAG TPA: DUF4349 domain-containing protein [Streptosporangiaceae bacterium]